VIAIPLAEIVESRIVVAYPKDKKLSVPAKNFWEFIRDYPR
jgi:hypothetical protein